MSPTTPYNAEPRGSRPCSWPNEQPVAGSIGGCHVGYSLPSGPTVEYELWISAEHSFGPGRQMSYARELPIGSSVTALGLSSHDAVTANSAASDTARRTCDVLMVHRCVSAIPMWNSDMLMSSTIVPASERSAPNDEAIRPTEFVMFSSSEIGNS